MQNFRKKVLLYSVEEMNKTTSNRPKLLLAMPLPPPYSGQETITQMVLASPLKEMYQISHIDTSHKAGNAGRGALSIRNIWYVLKNSAHLALKIRREVPDIVHVPMAGNRPGFIKFASFVLVSKLLGRKVTSRIGGSHFDKTYDREHYILRWVMKFTIGRLDALIVRADSIKETFLQFLPEDKLWLVRIGLPASMFEHVSLSKELASGSRNVLFIGYISKAKGALDLLSVIPQIVEEHPDANFHFAGEMMKQERNVTFVESSKMPEEEFSKAQRDPRLEEHIELLGVLAGEDKIEAISNASIFVLPSYAEGFPFAVLEAMLAGKAVITTPVGALPEVFVDGEHLLYVEPGNTEQLAKAISDLLADDAFRQRIGYNARYYVQTNLNLDVLATKMDEVFRAVMDT